MTIQIDYDRSERVYKWIEPDSGQIFTFPPRQKGAALQFAVSMLDPELFDAAGRVIANQPQLERVTWRAVELVCNNAVTVFDVPRGNVEAMIESSDGYGRYAITNDNGHMVCQCEHWQSMAAPLTQSGRRYCKHILALYLWRVTREDRF